MDYYTEYLEYKKKYLDLKNGLVSDFQIGSGFFDSLTNLFKGTTDTKNKQLPNIKSNVNYDTNYNTNYDSNYNTNTDKTVAEWFYLYPVWKQGYFKLPEIIVKRLHNIVTKERYDNIIKQSSDIIRLTPNRAYEYLIAANGKMTQQYIVDFLFNYIKFAINHGPGGFQRDTNFNFNVEDDFFIPITRFILTFDEYSNESGKNSLNDSRSKFINIINDYMKVVSNKYTNDLNLLEKQIINDKQQSYVSQITLETHEKNKNALLSKQENNRKKYNLWINRLTNKVSPENKYTLEIKPLSKTMPLQPNVIDLYKGKELPSPPMSRKSSPPLFQQDKPTLQKRPSSVPIINKSINNDDMLPPSYEAPLPPTRSPKLSRPLPQIPTSSNQSPKMTRPLPKISDLSNQSPKPSRPLPKISDLSNQSPKPSRPLPQISDLSNKSPKPSRPLP